MKHEARLARLEKRLPAPEQVNEVFWPCDNGKGYYADQDGKRIPFSHEGIESWEKGAPGRRAIIIQWGKQGVTHEHDNR